jgi:hypothetical protein
MTLGLLSMLGGVLVFLQYIANTTVLGYNPRNATGWTSTMIVMLFIAGAQLFGMGLLGEYIGRIFEEIKARPVYIVERAVNVTRQPSR